MTRADELARSAASAVEAVRLGVRAFTPVDTNRVPAAWRHVTKVDPEDEKELPLLYPLYLRHTSAVSVGGSRDVTAENTAETFELLEHLPVPAFHEPSGPRHVTDETRRRAAFLAIPEVLNGDVDSLIGKLGAGAEHIRDELVPALIREQVPWLPAAVERRVADFATGWMLSSAVFEAYIIQNVDSAAAREANVTADDLLSPPEAARRALAAEKHLDSDLIYLEYSGTFGGDEAVAILEAVDDAVSWPRIWYGGGLDSRENARAVLDAGADAVVVGDVFHEAAEAEADLCAAAVDDLSPDADRERVEAWVDERVDDDTPGARYLSTVPTVADPAGQAREYLADAVQVRLDLAALAADVDATDADGVRAAVGARDPSTLPGARKLERALGADGAALAREYAVAFLAAERGVDHDSALPLSHINLF